MSLLVEDDEIDYEPMAGLPTISFNFEYKRGEGEDPPNAQKSSTTCNVKKRRLEYAEVARESDVKRLANRQKQVEYGKNTVGYEKYIALVPKNKRSREDPRTPNKFQLCSKRSWDGQISKWRQLLHRFDPE